MAPKTKKKQFRWTDYMVDKVITSLHKFKSTMEYKNLDFDGDRPVQYAWLREEMARIFAGEDETLFGPVDVYSADPEVPLTEMTREEKSEYTGRVKADKENIKKGYARIKEKVKEIRQSFSIAVTTGKRSGSGKIVFEYYDRLVSLWGGSAATEPLSFGVDGDFFNCDIQDQEAGDNSSVNITPNTIYQLEEGCDNAGTLCDDDQIHESDTDNPEIGSQEGASTGIKRKSGSQVPRLIDNKRKHLQKNLSAAQRDQLLLNEAKEDSQFRKDLAEAMRQSTESFSKALEGMSNSMLQIGAGMSRSIEVMAQSMMMGPQAVPINQNLFYQDHDRAHHGRYAGQNSYNHVSNYQNRVSSLSPDLVGGGIPHPFQSRPSTLEDPDNAETRYHKL